MPLEQGFLNPTTPSYIVGSDDDLAGAIEFVRSSGLGVQVWATTDELQAALAEHGIEAQRLEGAQE